MHDQYERAPHLLCKFWVVLGLLFVEPDILKDQDLNRRNAKVSTVLFFFETFDCSLITNLAIVQGCSLLLDLLTDAVICLKDLKRSSIGIGFCAYHINGKKPRHRVKTIPWCRAARTVLGQPGSSGTCLLGHPLGDPEWPGWQPSDSRHFTNVQRRHGH